MPLVSYIWLLLCYANLARSSLMEEFQGIIKPEREETPLQLLPIPVDENRSGCNCRATAEHDLIVCFGFYTCTAFPKVEMSSKRLKVKSTNIKVISNGQMDHIVDVRYLEIDSNRNLERIESYAFKNLTNLEHLSISFNIKLKTLDENVFVGLIRLTNLTLINNGLIQVQDATRALSPVSLPSLQRLDISENYFVTISENDFEPMMGSNVSDIVIFLSQIEYIHPKSFLPLQFLKSLHIGENNLLSPIIDEMLLELQKAEINITLLDISRMGFRKVPPFRLMEIIARSTISRLILAENTFESLLNDTFPRMENIELLDLRQDLIVYIESDAFGPSKFPSLKVLLLSGNNLLGLQIRPSSHLKYLDLSHNGGNEANPGYFNVAPTLFQNMSHLEVLNLSFNRIVTLYNFTFQGLKQLKILSIKNGSIFHIELDAFKSLSNLEMLSLENNPFIQNNDGLKAPLFRGMNSLKILILSNCGLRSFEDGLFNVFPNLTHLILKNNKLITITPETLQPLKKLTVLDLSNNLIVAWLDPLFKPSRAPIHYLGLNNNKITRFTVSMLEDFRYILKNGVNNSEVFLNGNVFVCDCNSMYVAFSWMMVNGSDYIGKFLETSRVSCTAPSSWERKSVASYLSTYHGLNCSIYHSKMIVVIYTLATIFIVLLLVVTVVAMYVYRFYISYWIFLAKLALGRRHVIKNAKDIVQKTNYSYDAFVSYSSEDRVFVMDMITELENKSPFYKLCVYERDFQIGSYISEAIHTNISDSKFIILIVSDHFAKSQWCRWEMQLAEYHRLFLDGSYNYDPLILVRVGEVRPKNLTPTLKYLLKTKIYLNWEDGDKKEEFWNKLRNVLIKS